jgi:protein-tyrosine phosphatase
MTYEPDREPTVTRLLFVAALLCALAPIGGQAANPVRIAFVDTGNTGRSVTAEALASALIAKDGLGIQVISRAVEVNPYNIVPEPMAAALLAAHGIDVSAHRAAQLAANDVKFSDIILTMTAKHRDTVLAQFPQANGKVFTLAEYATGEPEEIADAWQQPKAVYEKAFEQIGRLVPLALARAAKR